MWPIDVLRSFRNRRERHPHSASITLSLEPLEERWLPNGTITAAASPPSPPSFVGAASALFWDGVQLIDDQYTGNTAFGAVFFGNNQGIAGVNASIAYFSPYAGGPFASLFVLAGEVWEYENLLIGHAEAESF